MNSIELRNKFLQFFEKKGHKLIPSASLVPKEQDITESDMTLFTTAGMQQFKRFYINPDQVPYACATSSQKCIRTGDIDEVGDDTHLSFFEMLGNFSFGYPKKEGSYFKKEAIDYAWGFLTQELGISTDRIYATYFDSSKSEKNKDVPTDNESKELLENISELNKIIPQGDDNFWSLGSEGSPGGPTVEFYIDGIEVWNLVFNEYVMKNGKYEPSEFKGVDTGMGLERLLTTLNGHDNVYETDLFEPIIKKLEETSDKKYEENKKAFRIIADHIKTATFLSSEDIQPSNTDRGYVMRRLIRRAIRYGNLIKLGSIVPIISAVIYVYREIYPDLGHDQIIITRIIGEEKKFEKTLDEGLKKAEYLFSNKTPIDRQYYSQIMQIDNKKGILKSIHNDPCQKNVLTEIGIPVNNQTILKAYINGKEAFDLFQSYGFPIEMIIDLAQEKGLFVSITEFNEELEKHQDLSRTASAGMFKGGLADGGEMAIKYHTTTHLLHQALRQVLGDHVQQKGSNITAERLRFDFTHPDKMTPEQIAEVEKIVNEQIEKDLPVKMEEMTPDEAKVAGALGFFEHKYGDRVKVYTIGDFSKEICGGPHVERIGTFGHFKIQKEESSSAGVRRIKAVLK